jgi:cellulose biosynthesis protein BcsQ
MPDVTFDNALETVATSVNDSNLDLHGCEATLLRDLTGRIRLHVARPESHVLPEDAKSILKQALAQAAPYSTDIVYLDILGRPSRDFPLLEKLHAERTPFAVSAGSRSPSWYRFERRFSKDSWLQETRQVQEPWPLEDGSPVISFFGFKGGVGRTTALASFALYLADLGRNIVAVDLDLEAPGLAALLAGEATPIDLGVIDYLLEERIARPQPLALSRFYLSSPFPAGAGNLRIMPAGRMDANYVEKLGRIDVQGLVQPTHAVRVLLKKMIERIRAELRPDAILLDVRAGLHDLGGVSLSGLSHLELIFAVHSDQSWAGLPLILAHLGRLRADWIKLVHTMVPPAGRGGDEIHEAFIAKAYDFCSEHYYLEGDVPGPQDESAAHWAYRLPFREALMGLSDLNISRTDLLSDEHRLFCEQLARDTGLGD